MDPSFYRKVKRSGQKGSCEKPKKLTRKLNQRKKGQNLEEENRNKNAHSYYSDTSGSESKSRPDPNKFSKSGTGSSQKEGLRLASRWCG